MKNKTNVVLSIVGLVLLVVATFGVAYAIFNYTKEGTTENTVTVGNLKFLYTEVSGVGNGISITDTLPISDILQMLVWIPRYKYALPTGTGTREISVEFENKSTSKSNGTAVDTDYLTHPAFTFGD